MGRLGNAFNETMANMSGCGMLLLLAVPFACVSTVMNKHDEAKEVVSARDEQAKSCQAERQMTDEESLNQCQNAAALFGQDISDNISRLSSCVALRQSKIASCEAEGL